MKVPRVYEAINAVAADLALAGIPKSNTNLKEQYQYRSIDDVLNRLAPLLARHRLCVLPRVLERVTVDRPGMHGALIVSVSLMVAFDLVSAVDGSRHRVRTFGEAVDDGDKATAKAMSAAYKAAMLQTFCIPVAGNDDGDASSIKLRQNAHAAAPVQGWDQWSCDIADTIGICESAEALERVQTSNRDLLKALSRERPELYASTGEAFKNRSHILASPGPSPSTREPAGRTNGCRPRTGRAAKGKVEEPAHA